MPNSSVGISGFLLTVGTLDGGGAVDGGRTVDGGGAGAVAVDGGGELDGGRVSTDGISSGLSPVVARQAEHNAATMTADKPRARRLTSRDTTGGQDRRGRCLAGETQEVRWNPLQDQLAGLTMSIEAVGLESAVGEHVDGVADNYRTVDAAVRLGGCQAADLLESISVRAE